MSHFRYAGSVSLPALGLAVSLCLAGSARAQESGRTFSVTTRAGGITFDRAASLRPAPALGVDAVHGLSRLFAIGISTTVSRPNTRAEDFLTAITFGIPTAGDTIFFYEVAQSVNLVEGNLMLQARMPVGRLTPFLTAGAGYYSIFVDPQLNNARKRRFGGASFALGGGATFRLSPRAGIQLDVRDMIMTNFDAEALDPTGGRNRNIWFPEDFSTVPTRKKSLNNLMFSLGFQYLPGADASTEEGSR